MVEATPSPPLEMPQPDLLLEVLIVALDAPAQLGGVDQIDERDAFRQGRQPIFGGLILALRPLDQQPLLGRLHRTFVARCDANTHAGKPRGQPFNRAFAPLDHAPRFRAQPDGKLFDRDRIGRVPAALLRGTARPFARRPYQRLRLNAGHIDLAKRCDAGAQLGVLTIAGVQQRHVARKARLTRPADVLERDLRLGLELDVLRHSCLGPTAVILGPVFRQIQPIGHRQARRVVGNRQRYGDLAVRLLAQLPAVLGRHPNRMPSLLGKARVVDDPGRDRSMTLDLRQHHLANLGQNRLVRPSPLADKMQQRLMLCRSSPRRRDRSHRLNALALTRHHQAPAIVAQWPSPIRMPDHAHKTLDIVRKPRFNALRSAENHPNPLYLNGNRLRYLILKSPNLRPSDSVVLAHVPAKWTRFADKEHAPHKESRAHSRSDLSRAGSLSAECGLGAGVRRTFGGKREAAGGPPRGTNRGTPEHWRMAAAR